MVDATRFFGCMVASRGGYRMARGRHYAKLSLSNAARLSFSDLCILLFLFLSLCRLCVCVFLCFHWSLVDVPLIFFCPADHVPDWQPRVLLGMVEARSVNVKKTTTTTVFRIRCYVSHHRKILPVISILVRKRLRRDMLLLKNTRLDLRTSNILISSILTVDQFISKTIILLRISHYCTEKYDINLHIT